MSSTYPPPADALEPLNPEKEPGMKCPEKTPEVAFEAVSMLDEDPAPSKDHVMEIPQRESWSGKMDFIISCVGYCIGLGNVWRFSYLCFKNGGGAFLIPYIIMVIVGGVPMYFLELAIGQYHQSGCLGIWSKRPAFKGIGYASLVITMWCNCYYPIVMAWALWYLFHSFRAVLPWSSCDNEWNSAQCVTSSLQGRASCYNATDYALGQTANISLILTDDPDVAGNNSLPICPYNSSDYAALNETTSSEVEFWTYHTIRQSGGIEETGDFHYQMALLLLLVWLLCYFCIWKGVKWSGKVVYVTALFPYVLILVLLVRGVTLPGAAEGIRFYLSPQVHRLADSQVWIDAASQVFFSTGVGYGVVVVLGSYNGFHQDIYKSAILVSLINALTSLTAGFAIFSALGFLAHRLGKTVADVVASGPGLAFIVYPSALSQLPVSPFWAVLFFLMLFFVGFDTQFCMMEGFFTSVIDEFPKQLRKRRELFIGLCCIASFLVGLTMVTQSGIYIFQLMEWYAGSRVALIFVVFSESLTYGWFIDRDGFYPQIEEMIGYRPNPIFKACWKFVTPAICLGIFLFSLVQYIPVTYQGASYPGWAEAVGWMFTLSSILWIPGVLLFTILRTEGSFTQRLRTLSWR